MAARAGAAQGDHELGGLGWIASLADEVEEVRDDCEESLDPSSEEGGFSASDSSLLMTSIFTVLVPLFGTVGSGDKTFGRSDCFGK